MRGAVLLGVGVGRATRLELIARSSHAFGDVCHHRSDPRRVAIVLVDHQSNARGRRGDWWQEADQSMLAVGSETGQARQAGTMHRRTDGGLVAAGLE